MGKFKSQKSNIIKNNSYDRKPVIAAITAFILMLVLGIGYKALAAKIAGDVGTLSISPETLDKFPIQIGDWEGSEVPLDEEIVEATDTDAHISRNYKRKNGIGTVWYYVAFGINARDLMPHRPEVCYIGAGWTQEELSSIDLSLDNDKVLPVSIFEFKRGLLNNERLLVLDYYLVDGIYCRDVSLVRSEAWLGSSKIGYVAQVQIVSSIPASTDADSIEKIISSFAIESAPVLTKLLEENKENSSENIPNISDKEESE